MPMPDSTNGIADEAARWAVRATYGEMTERARGELEAWLATDRRHRGAYLRACAGLCAMEDAVREAPRETGAVNDNLFSPPPEATGFRGWRRAAIASGALAACAAGLLLTGEWNVPFAVSEEAAGERVALADGSVATLSENARIATLIDGERRVVIVRSGQATFQVARDPARPFIVRTGGIYAQATGTVYSVRKLGASGGEVAVSEGTVLVWAEGARSRAVSLGAGEAIALDAALAAPAPTETERAQLAAQRSPGEISLDNVPIAAAAKRFNAVNETKIVVDDPAIGNTPIVGLFSADDPEGFARAAAAVAGARTQRQGDTIAIKM